VGRLSEQCHRNESKQDKRYNEMIPNERIFFMRQLLSAANCGRDYTSVLPATVRGILMLIAGAPDNRWNLTRSRFLRMSSLVGTTNNPRLRLL